MANNVRSLVDARNQIQKARISFENRVGAIERGTDDPVVIEGEVNPISQKYFKIFDDLEKNLTGDLEREAADVPIVKQMVNLNGISFTTAAQLYSMIDISRCPTISALWRYAGYGCGEDGVIDRIKKGEKSCFNRRLKCLLHVVATNFLRSKKRSPFRDVYDKAKKKYEKKIENGEWEKKNGWKAHVHMAAMRKMKKIFLATLWTRWRELEGLQIRTPYVEEYLKHNHIYKPEDFGWVPINKR